MSIDSYHYAERPGGDGTPLFFVFHGTGGDEHQFLDLPAGLTDMPHVIAPRGDVMEGGARRYFRRTGEGIYDYDDLARRTQAMAGFVEAHAAAAQGRAVIGLGYSNGANILACVVFARPALFDAVVLMHPLIPFQPQVDGTLDKTRVLVTAGRRDPICPPNMTHRLESHLKALGARTETFWHDGGHEIRPGEIEAARSFLAAGDIPEEKGNG